MHFPNPEGTSNARSRWFAIGVFLLIGLSTVGCANTTTSNAYGLSDGIEARRSPGGASVFRGLCTSTGRKATSVNQLTSYTADDLDSIVWMPHSFDQHFPATIAWMSQWLHSGNKTLIYVGRDYSPSAEYWQLSSDLLSDPNSKDFDKIAAEKAQTNATIEDVKLSTIRWGVTSRQFLPWALHEHGSPDWTLAQRLDGSWAHLVGGQPHRIVYRSVLYPYDGLPNGASEQIQKADDDEAFLPEELEGAVNSQGPISIKARPWNFNSLTPRKNWMTDRPSRELFEGTSEVLLSGENGEPLITRVVLAYQPSSQILLVSTPSLISNLSMTYAGNRALAKMIVDEMPPGKAGFISSATDPTVREKGELAQQKGFEMFTMWPLSMITLHAAFLGIVTLLALYPIFGRPKELPEVSAQDFSQHIDSLGSLLQKSRDEDYALETISEYFKNVKKEPNSPWAKINRSEF